MSQLSVLMEAAAPHMARRLQNNADSDGRHAGQPLFLVAQTLEPMVVPRADELSLNCIPASVKEMEAAVEELQGRCYQEYIKHVIRFLGQKFPPKPKAYNVVALMDSTASVPAHQLQYDHLLRWMPASAAESIIPLDSNMCKVPSGQENSRVYDICSDIGTCTCAAGQQGAFCKHQALVHHHYGGPFPNAPVLTPRDRHQLGLLALGKKCPAEPFFKDFQGPSIVPPWAHPPVPPWTHPPVPPWTHSPVPPWTKELHNRRSQTGALL
ncbi:uncharacterized protein ISCGN_026995 [Ixodes scapularis]